MRPILSLLLVLSLAALPACASSADDPLSSTSAQSPAASSAPAQSHADSSLPTGSEQDTPVFVDDPASLYPMVVDSWQLDLNGDGAEETLSLRAEKFYVGKETDSNWYESADNGLKPYTLLITEGNTTAEFPLGRDSNAAPPLRPCYFSVTPIWIEDLDGQPVLVLSGENMSAGGAGDRDVFALSYRDGAIVSLPVPRYSLQGSRTDMLAQVTVPETGCHESLDLNKWLSERNMTPVLDETGNMTWPAAPSNIDGFFSVNAGESGVELRQYIWGTVHVDGMGSLVTELNWRGGEPVVLSQQFDWGF